MCYKMFSALVLLALWSAPGYAKSECKIIKYAELPVTMQHMQPLIKGTINGKPARFLLDTGGFYSVIYRSSVTKFGLDLRMLPWNIGRIRGANGTIGASLTTAEDFSLTGFFNGRIFHHADFIVIGNSAGADYDGLIGQNIYGHSQHGDIEFDLANGVIRLFAVEGCHHANLAYWAGSSRVASMSFRREPESHHIIGRALLNGRKIHVLFDSGATYSVLSLHAAKRVGIVPQGNGVADAGFSGGISTSRTELWIAHFDSLDMHGEVIKNARLRVSNISLGSIHADMVLGADFFLSHHIFISNSQHRIYFTYNGGPVFDLRDINVKAKLAKAASHSGSPATKSADKDDDASSLKRRAMASANRHEYVAALADFDALIKLAPHDADNYLQRGLAYLGNQQPKLALSDLDLALKIKPDLTRALLARGSIRLKKGDDTGAREDFDAAMQSAHGDSTVKLEIGDTYLSAGKFEQAIAQFDTWIGANPNGEQLPFALTQRCYARALADKQLKLALDDCKSARWKVRDDSHLLGSLALVYMRLGNYDDAVKYYKKSIDLQPKSAWVLYGLGLAEERDGSQAEGARSIRSAVALNPDVAKAYKTIGLSP